MSHNVAVDQTARPDLPMGSETILLVDDDPLLRRVLSRRLRGLGHRIFEAESGAAAMAQLAGLPDISLLFTDIVMPGGMRASILQRQPW